MMIKFKVNTIYNNISYNRNYTHREKAALTLSV